MSYKLFLAVFLLHTCVAASIFSCFGKSCVSRNEENAYVRCVENCFGFYTKEHAYDIQKCIEDCKYLKEEKSTSEKLSQKLKDLAEKFDLVEFGLKGGWKFKLF
ncbi:unnamed protein product [Cylicocyclus nassatus]|uniref:Uncharacterized protein n=1 Tax=Cylicocyclus nassatus TaxID=53992 RepID=A0AA36GGU2_CYLNA|nr:unnamed protein product [Cylicocyclus nassatus]